MIPSYMRCFCNEFMPSVFDFDDSFSKKVYDALVAKFGSKNVYIATSDVQDGDKSPLSFNDKKEDQK